MRYSDKYSARFNGCIERKSSMGRAWGGDGGAQIASPGGGRWREARSNKGATFFLRWERTGARPWRLERGIPPLSGRAKSLKYTADSRAGRHPNSRALLQKLHILETYQRHQDEERTWLQTVQNQASGKVSAPERQRQCWPRTKKTQRRRSAILGTSKQVDTPTRIRITQSCRGALICPNSTI